MRYLRSVVSGLMSGLALRVQKEASVPRVNGGAERGMSLKVHASRESQLPFHEAYEVVRQERLSSSAEGPAAPMRQESGVSSLMRQLLPQAAVSGARFFPQHEFPNLETAKLVLEKHRGDGLFDPVFRRHDALLSRQKRLDASAASRGEEVGVAAIHSLLRSKPVDTAIDAARLLPVFLTEAAAAFATATAIKDAPTSVRHLFNDAAFVSSFLEQVFLSVFFTTHQTGLRAHTHSQLSALWKTFPAYERWSYQELLRSSSAMFLVGEALEVCLARLLLASPFSFHVAFEYLCRQKALGPSHHIPLTLFRLWWVVNPDQVPLELESPSCRLLPSLFDGATCRFVSSPTKERGDSEENSARTLTYKAGVMSALQKLSTQHDQGSAFVLTPELFYPYEREAAYESLLKVAAEGALGSGDSKYNLSSPLLPRVMQLCASSSAFEGTHQKQALVRLLFSRSILTLACAMAPHPSQEFESWLTLCGLMTALGMLNRSAHQLRRLPRKGKQAPTAFVASSASYEGCLTSLRLEFVTFVETLVRDSGNSCYGAHGKPGEGSDRNDLKAWSQLVFTTVSYPFEGSGALSPSMAHRPLTMSLFWRQLHRQCLSVFPHVFHAGSSTVATLFALAAIEGVSGTPAGGTVTALTKTSVGREIALYQWRRLWDTARPSSSPTSDTFSHRGRQKQVTYLLSRVTSSASDVVDGCTGVQVADSTRRRHRPSLPPVSHAEKDIEYPPHSFASGCGGSTGGTERPGGSSVSEACEALQNIRTAVLSIAEAYVRAPWLKEHANTLSPGARATAGEAAPALSTRGQPSFFVLLKALQVLSTLGESCGGPPTSRGRGNAVAECVRQDILDFANPVVAGYMSKLAVQCLTHSTAMEGAAPLLTKEKCLLDSLSPEAAWGRVLTALLWSGLPSGPVAEALFATDCAHEASSAKRPEWTPAFGSGSFAWVFMKNDLARNPVPEEEEEEEEAEEYEMAETARQAAIQRAKTGLTLSLDHLLALALQVSDDVIRPTTLALVFRHAMELDLTRVVLGGKESTDGENDPLSLVEPVSEAVSGKNGQAHHDDFEDYSYQLESEIEGEEPVSDEPSDDAWATTANGDGDLGLFTDETRGCGEGFHFSAAVQEASTDAEGASEVELKRNFLKALATYHPASAHVYISFLELLGMCTVALSAHTLSRLPTRISLVSLGYLALASTFGIPCAGPPVKTRAARAVSPELSQELKKPRTLVKLILLHLHTMPDLDVLPLMVLSLTTSRSTEPQTPLLPRRVLSSLCQLFYHSGICHSTVRSWRVGYPVSSTQGREGVAAAHAAILASIGESLPCRDEERRRELTLLLGSLVLAIVESQATRASSSLFDGREFYINAFLAPVRVATPGPAGRELSQEKNGCPIGVVLPSQQLVSLSTAAGMDTCHRAETWSEAKRRLQKPVSTPFRAAMSDNTDRVQSSLKSLETNHFVHLFTE